MLERPTYSPQYHVEVVEPEGVYLLSERGHTVLNGAVHCRWRMLRRWLPTRTLARTSRLAALGLLAALVAVAATLQSVVPLLAAGTLDQLQAAQNQHGGVAPTFMFGGQTFTAGLTGLLDQVGISIAQQGNIGNLTVDIRTVDGSGLPTTTILGSGTVPMSTVPACCPGAIPQPGQQFPVEPIALTTIPLTAPAPVVAGTQYAIVFIPESPWTLYNSGANPYAGGQAVTLSLNGTAGWQPIPNTDLAFQTFVTQAAVSVGDAQAVEGDGGVGYLVFPVVLGFAVGADVTVPYTLANGSATGGAACGPGVDFVNTGGTVAIPAGGTGGGIVVPICGETSIEPDETLTVTLGAPTTAVLGTGQALGTIRTNDLAPTATPTHTATPTSTVAPTNTAIPTHTATPTNTSTPVPTFAAGPTATPGPVRLSVQRAGNGRLLVTISAIGPIERVTWPSVPNVVVETADGAPIPGRVLTMPGGSLTAVFYVRKTGGSSATLPLTVTGAFGTWQTFVGGGPNAW